MTGPLVILVTPFVLAFLLVAAGVFIAAWKDVTRAVRWARQQRRPDTVPGGVRALCLSCTRQQATQPHPDGGPGGVCIECWMELSR